MSVSRPPTEGPRQGAGGEGLPPLGARVEAVEPGPGASGARPWIVTVVAGLLALGLGLGLGVAAGFLLDDGDGGAEDAPNEKGAADTDDDAGTSDAPSDEVVPQRCIDAIELADDGLVLLDRAVASVGDLDPGDLDEVLQSAEVLRPDLEQAIRDCRSDL